MSKKLFIFVGPSASGKTTIENELIRRYKFKRLVQSTSRVIRPMEEDSVDYYFRSTKECLELDNATEIHISEDWVYSLQESEIKDKFEGCDNILYSCINSEPALELEKYIKENEIAEVKIILFNIDIDERIKLLKARGDSMEDIKVRLGREENLKLSVLNFDLEINNLESSFRNISRFIELGN